MRPLNWKYRTELLHPVLSIECRKDKLGNVYYYVTFTVDREMSFAFKKLDSAIDFIQSNFNSTYKL